MSEPPLTQNGFELNINPTVPYRSGVRPVLADYNPSRAAVMILKRGFHESLQAPRVRAGADADSEGVARGTSYGGGGRRGRQPFS